MEGDLLNSLRKNDEDEHSQQSDWSYRTNEPLWVNNTGSIWRSHKMYIQKRRNPKNVSRDWKHFQWFKTK